MPVAGDSETAKDEFVQLSPLTNMYWTTCKPPSAFWNTVYGQYEARPEPVVPDTGKSSMLSGLPLVGEKLVRKFCPDSSYDVLKKKNSACG